MLTIQFLKVFGMSSLFRQPSAADSGDSSSDEDVEPVEDKTAGTETLIGPLSRIVPARADSGQHGQ